MTYIVTNQKSALAETDAFAAFDWLLYGTGDGESSLGLAL